MFTGKTNFRKSALLLTAALALALTAAAGCSETREEGLEEITILLDWTPNTNYSGLYAAKEHGFFEEEGLQVEIIQASGNVLQMIAADQAQFGVSYQEEITFARLEGVPVVSIAAIIQQNTSGFASLKEKGIETPAQFEGSSYGGWGSPIEEATIKALMEPFDAAFEKVEFLTTGELDSLVVLREAADFAWIYYGWTGVEAELQGMELNFIQLRDIDPALDYYTPTLATSEKLIEEDPQMVERFMKAASKGYRLAIEKPEKAALALLDNAPELDEELVYASQEWLSDKYQAGAEVWGLQERDTWQSYTLWLYERDLIDDMIDVDQAFTNQFIQ